MKVTNRNVIRKTKESDHYATPSDFLWKLDAEFRFTFDPCPLRCKEFDGLAVPWEGVIFCNPPYSNIEPWLMKGIEEIEKGNCKKVLYLIPAYTSSLYWHNIILKKAAEIRLLIGRLKFGDQKNVAPLHIALVILDTRLKGNPKFVSYKR